MGINNEYSIDAFTYTDVHDEDFDEFEDDGLAPEDWHDWNSEHLLNMWMSLRQYLSDNHASSSLMNNASFHDFAEFVRTFSR
jgi:hypothetical protein